MSSSRRERSLRAQARARYLQAAEAEAHHAEAHHKDSCRLTPSPTLPQPNPGLPGFGIGVRKSGKPDLRRGREPAELAAPDESTVGELSPPGPPLLGPAGGSTPPALSLNERARALYEGGVVLVREIARLCAVSERTIYKHARRLGWTPRVTRLAGDGTPTAAQRAARGAGGRFVPHAHGPQGARCRRAAGSVRGLRPGKRARRPGSGAGARGGAGACRARGVATRGADARAHLQSAQRRARRAGAAAGRAGRAPFAAGRAAVRAPCARHPRPDGASVESSPPCDRRDERAQAR